MPTNNSPIKTILIAGSITGLLDGTAAIVQYLLNGKSDPGKIFQYIASAVYGMEKAYAGGTNMIIQGILFHLVIAFVWAIIFFFGYPFFHKLIRNNIVVGFVYGLLVWAIMNRLVVPMTKIGSGTFHLKNAIIGTLILMFCIGLPNAFITARYYRDKT